MKVLILWFFGNSVLIYMILCILKTFLHKNSSLYYAMMLSSARVLCSNWILFYQFYNPHCFMCDHWSSTSNSTRCIDNGEINRFSTSLLLFVNNFICVFLTILKNSVLRWHHTCHQHSNKNSKISHIYSWPAVHHRSIECKAVALLSQCLSTDFPSIQFTWLHSNRTSCL